MPTEKISFMSNTLQPKHKAILDCAKRVKEAAIAEVKAAGLDPSLVANVCALAAAIMCFQVKEVFGQNQAATMCLDALQTLVGTAEDNGILEAKPLKKFN
jgi:hypothetical protein